MKPSFKMSTDRIASLAQDHFDRGHDALREGNARDAIEEFTRAIKLRPTVAAGYRFRAMAHRAVNDRPSAIADFTEAIAQAPDDAQLRAERAGEYLKQQRYDLAIADCNEAIRLDPGRGDVIGIRAAANGRRGDTAAALADYETALATDSERAFEYYCSRGRLYLELEDYPSAIRDATAAVALKDDHLPAYELRALARQRGKLYAEAETDFREILSREPDNRAGRLGLAFALVEQRKWVECLEAVEEVLAVLPNLARAFELRGLCHEQLGQFDDALASYAKGLDAGSDAALTLRAGVFLKMGEWANALRDALDAVRRGPDHPQALNVLAWIRATCPDDAIRNGSQALELALRACERTEFRDAGCLDSLAAAHGETGDFDQAIAFAERAIACAGHDVERQEFVRHLEQFRDGKPFRMSGPA
jgi:tetratricopeptide (TPR) repeat protein